MTDVSPQPAPPAAPSSAAAPRAPWWRRIGAAGWIAAAAVALFAWQWYDGRARFGALQQELARRLAEAESHAQASRALAEQARSAVAEAQVKLGVLEARIAESQSQQVALEALYQELSRNRDEWAFADIEQSLLLASQQLAVAGNIKAALIALQAAEARLQRLARPQLVPLRKALARDIERLKAHPYVDSASVSARLEALLAQLERWPLAAAARPRLPAPARAPEGGESLWWRLWRETWAELKQLVRIERTDRDDVAVLAPPEAYFLRENLRLRLLGARLALLARDQASFRTDVKAAREWLRRYYDTRDSGVASALATLGKLAAVEIGPEPPDISETLEALRAYRLARERGAR